MRPVDGGVRVTVRVKPRAARERVSAGDGAVDLVVAVSAPPVDGAANARVIELIADALGVAKRAVTVVRGDTARTKEIAIDGVTMAELAAHISGL
jgi:uncharacterized protein (TIGR00251 family)